MLIPQPDDLFRRARQRITVSLFAAQSLFSAAIIATFALTSPLAAELSGTDSAAGVPSTLSLLGRAAIAYPIGLVMDRLGRRAGLSIGFLLGLGGALVSVWAIIDRSFAGFLLGATLLGAARASAEQSRYVAAEIQPFALQARIMGTIVFAGTLGAIGGPLLVDPAGNLAAQAGLPERSGVFIIAALLLALALILTVAFVRPDPLSLSRSMRTAKGGDEPARESARPLRQIFARPAVILAVAAMLIGQLVMTLLMVITPLEMSHHQHDDQAISWVIMAHTLGMFGLSGVTGWLIDRFGRTAMIFAGGVLLIVAAIIAPLSPEVVPLAAALFLLGLGWNFCFLAGSALLAGELNVAERGRAQGASEMLVALGSGAGSLATGLLFDAGGMLAVALVGLFFSLALIGLLGWSTLPGRHAPGPGEAQSTP
jgi:MFS family permease